jgi:diaminopimelate decarboxylase
MKKIKYPFILAFLLLPLAINAQESKQAEQKAEEIISRYPTPFHIYAEKGIRENARTLYKAFS